MAARQKAAGRDEVRRCLTSPFPRLRSVIETHVSSGDGTLSVMDVRSKKPEPFAHSEDQEDELLSIVPFKG